MAGEANLQNLAEDMKVVRARVEDMCDFLDQTRTYALNLKNLVEAGEVSVQNFPATQPVSVPNPLPVSRTNTPEWEGWTVLPFGGSFTSSPGTLVAAQGAGVAVGLTSLVIGATSAVTVTLNLTGAALLIRLAANGTVVLPFSVRGWGRPANNTALTVTWSGSNTITAYGLWTAV